MDFILLLFIEIIISLLVLISCSFNTCLLVIKTFYKLNLSGKGILLKNPVPNLPPL